jgi:hypothetical protein
MRFLDRMTRFTGIAGTVLESGGSYKKTLRISAIYSSSVLSVLRG